jgi:hypothetical protein
MLRRKPDLQLPSLGRRISRATDRYHRLGSIFSRCRFPRDPHVISQTVYYAAIVTVFASSHVLRLDTEARRGVTNAGPESEAIAILGRDRLYRYIGRNPGFRGCCYYRWREASEIAVLHPLYALSVVISCVEPRVESIGAEWCVE